MARFESRDGLEGIEVPAGTDHRGSLGHEAADEGPADPTAGADHEDAAAER
jgi:hypothetical protein